MKPGPDDKIGERLREERTRLGLTRHQLAESAGCCYATVDNVENGRSEAKARLVAAVVKVGGRAEYILMGDTDARGRKATPAQCFFNRAHLALNAHRKEHPKSAALYWELIFACGGLGRSLRREPWEIVTREAHQVAAVACRISLEGDPLLAEERRIYGAEDMP